MDIAERLRFVEPISSRGGHLKRELRKLQGDEAEGGASGEQDMARFTDGKSNGSSSSSSNGGGDNSVGQADGGIKEAPASSDPPRVAANGSTGDGTAAAARGSDAHGGGTTAPAPRGNGCGGAGASGGTARSRDRRRSCRGNGGGGGDGGGAGAKRGFLPVCRATDPICPIVRIPPEEGHVFKTKQRAPTLITCEIIVPQPRRQDDVDDQRGWGSGQGEGRGSGSAHPSPPTANAPAGSFAKDAGGAVGSSGGGDRLAVARSRSLPLHRAVSRQGSGLAPRDGGVASPIHLLRRETSHSSDREEVEEIIGTQVAGVRECGDVAWAGQVAARLCGNLWVCGAAAIYVYNLSFVALPSLDTLD